MGYVSWHLEKAAVRGFGVCVVITFMVMWWTCLAAASVICAVAVLIEAVIQYFVTRKRTGSGTWSVRGEWVPVIRRLGWPSRRRRR